MLEEIELEWSPVVDDSPEGLFIQNAMKRIEIFRSENERFPGFEPSNYFAAAGVLHAIRRQRSTSDHRFCEWGSGFGVVTCLASMAGFDAWGIEAEEKLVKSARQLARDFGLGVQFHQGSYKTDPAINPEADTSTENGRPALSPFDCSVIYIYPWPAETAHITQRFEQLAHPGTWLVSYRGGGRFRIQRTSGNKGW